jgi:hypothetical protein
MNVEQIIPKLSGNLAATLTTSSKNLNRFAVMIIEGKDCRIIALPPSGLGSSVMVKESEPLRKMVSHVLGIPYFALKAVGQYQKSMDQIEGELEEKGVSIAIMPIKGECKYFELDKAKSIQGQIKDHVTGKTYKDFSELLKELV